MPFDLSMTPEEQLQESAFQLLRQKAEFIDNFTEEFFSSSEQREFSRLMSKLRRIAQVSEI